MRTGVLSWVVLAVFLVMPAAGQEGPPAAAPSTITAEGLSGTPNVVIVDARRPEHWESSSQQIAGAWRGAPEDVARWAGQFPPRSMIVVYCD